MNYIVTHWKPIAYLFGMIFEIIGALKLANRYLNMPWWSCGPALISAIYMGKKARGAIEIAALSEEKAEIALNGLAFLCIGFILRTTPYIAEL